MEPHNQLFTERHLRLRQIARRYNISYDTTRRMFMRKKGVVGITKPNPAKRAYTLWLVPENVVRDTFGAFTNGGVR
jgi:hypothetical protein